MPVIHHVVPLLPVSDEQASTIEEAVHIWNRLLLHQHPEWVKDWPAPESPSPAEIRRAMHTICDPIARNACSQEPA